jgi:hypothetical protein
MTIVPSAPFDDKYISLTSPLFAAPEETSYVNASRIDFPGCQQAFIAAQVDWTLSTNISTGRLDTIY